MAFSSQCRHIWISHHQIHVFPPVIFPPKVKTLDKILQTNRSVLHGHQWKPLLQSWIRYWIVHSHIHCSCVLSDWWWPIKTWKCFSCHGLLAIQSIYWMLTHYYNYNMESPKFRIYPKTQIFIHSVQYLDRISHFFPVKFWYEMCAIYRHLWWVTRCFSDLQTPGHSSQIKSCANVFKKTLSNYT